MKTKNLFPNRWKPIGWLLLVLCIPVGMWEIFADIDFPLSAEVTIPWPFCAEGQETNSILDFTQHNKNGTITLQLIDEIICSSVLAGLLIVGFSRVKNEDERIAQMRLESLQWAIYGNTLILVLCIAFIHGFLFLDVMIYNMFTPLLIFVLRFHWLLVWKEVRELKRQEGGEVSV
jgi:hypothetical protein